MIRNISPFMVKALLLLAVALTASTAAMAQSEVLQSYTGTWPIKASLPPHFANTGCLTLVDDGVVGGVHTGTASISGGLGGEGQATFFIVNNLLIVNLDDGGDNGVASTGLVLAHAMDGNLVGGFIESVYGGYAYPFGALTFGAKGGC